MDQISDKKIELKDRLASIYNENKLKIYLFIGVISIILISISIININNNITNKLIAEKYIKAGLYLASKEDEKSKNLYEEIILSKNKFYSILALNVIIEKNLVSDKNKILDYFQIVEEENKKNENLDLIIMKKALYLIKNSESDKGNLLLQKLKENSKFKSIAEDIINK